MSKFLKKTNFLDEPSSNNGVTEVIITEVFPDKEDDFREWIAKIHLVESKFAGFRGTHVQSPKENNGRFWVTLLQFDNMENLDKWLSSSERRNLINESKALISYLEMHRVISPYAGWFASVANIGTSPALWKQTMLVLLVLFPIVMLEMRYLIPYLKEFNISLSTFLGNALSVTLISFPFMPIAIYFLGWWLAPGNRKSTNVGGAVIVILLYLMEIYIFWDFI